jgi:hypothetical protein
LNSDTQQWEVRVQEHLPYKYRLDTQLIGSSADIAFMFDENGKKIYEAGYET